TSKRLNDEVRTIDCFLRARASFEERLHGAAPQGGLIIVFGIVSHESTPLQRPHLPSFRRVEGRRRRRPSSAQLVLTTCGDPAGPPRGRPMFRTSLDKALSACRRPHARTARRASPSGPRAEKSPLSQGSWTRTPPADAPARPLRHLDPRRGLQ